MYMHYSTLNYKEQVLRLKFTMVTCGADNRHQPTCVRKGLYTPLCQGRLTALT